MTSDTAKTAVLQEETRIFNTPQWIVEHSNSYRWMVKKGFKTEAEMRKWCSTNYIDFWDEMAKTYVDWFKPYTKILDDSEKPHYKWFTDGKVNVAYNAVDRHAKSAKRNKELTTSLASLWAIPRPSRITSSTERSTSWQTP
jgi:acetyl-CoA synthetase